MVKIGYEHIARLKLHTGLDYSAFGFDTGYFETLLQYMGIPKEKADLEAFKLSHLDVLLAFQRAKKVEASWVSIDTENDAVEKVQALAQKLSNELDRLCQTGQAGGRVHAEIASNDQTIFEHDGVKLADLLGHPGHDPFGAITDLLFDLRTGLERAKIKKPKNRKPPKVVQRGKKLAPEQRIDMVQLVAAAGRDETPEELYRKGVEGHALPASYSLWCFAYVFEEMWHQWSDSLFTEGRYEPDAKQRISSIVDAAEHCLRKYGETRPRSLIETNLQHIRKLRYGTAL